MFGAQVIGYSGFHVLESPRRAHTAEIPWNLGGARELKCMEVERSGAWVRRNWVLGSQGPKESSSGARSLRVRGLSSRDWEVME